MLYEFNRYRIETQRRLDIITIKTCLQNINFNLLVYSMVGVKIQKKTKLKILIFVYNYSCSFRKYNSIIFKKASNQ